MWTLKNIRAHKLYVLAYEWKKNHYITQVKMNKNFQCKILNFFLPIIFSICLGAQKNQQHMFWFRNKIIIFLLHTLN